MNASGAGLPAGDGAATARIVVPDLGCAGMTLVLSLWLVPEGSDVVEGDRVAEILAGGVTVDLGAPATGRLVRFLVDEDDVVAPGVVVAEIAATDLQSPAEGMAG